MGQVMIRYTVKPDAVEANAALVRNVYAGLRQAQPAGLRYVTFLLEDGMTFIHLASVEGVDGTSPLASLPAFQAFQRDIEHRCTVQPVVQVIDEVGSYRIFEGERAG